MQSHYSALPYFPLILPFDSWEKFVHEDCPKNYGVKWVYRRCKPEQQYAIRKERAGPPPPRKYRQRAPNRKWTITYRCQRAGKTKGVSLTSERRVLKRSNKIGCEATLTVEYKYSDPDNVLLNVSGDHNHVLDLNSTASAQSEEINSILTLDLENPEIGEGPSAQLQLQLQPQPEPPPPHPALQHLRWTIEGVRELTNHGDEATLRQIELEGRELFELLPPPHPALQHLRGTIEGVRELTNRGNEETLQQIELEGRKLFELLHTNHNAPNSHPKRQRLF